MIDPNLLASVPYGSATAFQDLIGTVELIHAQLFQAIAVITAGLVIPKRIPLDAEANPEDMLQAIQARHQSMANALGIGAPPDLQSFDLSRAEDWSSWTFLLAGDLTRLRDAAGIV